MESSVAQRRGMVHQEGEQIAPNGVEANVEVQPTRDTKFPVVLHYVLSELEKEQHMSHIVGWQPHGRCFIVHQQQEFVHQVLPNWFRQSKYTSFQRQLNIYGFKRIKSGPDQGAYYHDLFLRGKPALAHFIPRMSVKGTGPRGGGSAAGGAAASAPDFYNMEPMPPTSTSSGPRGGSAAAAPAPVPDFYNMVPMPPPSASCITNQMIDAAAVVIHHYPLQDARSTALQAMVAPQELGVAHIPALASRIGAGGDRNDTIRGLRYVQLLQSNNPSTVGMSPTTSLFVGGSTTASNHNALAVDINSVLLRSSESHGWSNLAAGMTPQTASTILQSSSQTDELRRALAQEIDCLKEKIAKNRRTQLMVHLLTQQQQQQEQQPSLGLPYPTGWHPTR